MMSEDIFIERLMRRLHACDLCPHQCGVDRFCGQKGICQNDANPRIYQHFLHFGEETCLVPAFVINMAGCNLSCPACPERCRFCQPPLNVKSPEHYAEAMAAHFKKTQMPRSIEWIGGEPSTQLLFVYQTTKTLKSLISDCPPVYLNTNGFFDEALLSGLIGVIDGFVFDLKCVSGCSESLVGSAAYWKTVTGVIQKSYMKFREIGIIRHLVMPGHVECCTEPVILWCCEHVPEMNLNLMTTFQNFNVGEESDHLSTKDRERALWVFEQSGHPHRMINGKYVV